MSTDVAVSPPSARSLLKASLRRLGATRVGWTAARLAAGPPGVVVLMYHRIAGDDVFPGVGAGRFRRQMLWLQRHCTLIAPEHLEGSLARGNRRRPAVLLTFDDGYRDFHDLAFPVLKELQIPALVFLSTAFMDEGGGLWADALRFAVMRTQRTHVSLPWPSLAAYPLDTAQRRRHLLGLALAHLKRQPDDERRCLLAALFQVLGFGEEGPALGRPMMNWAEVRATQPLVRLGGHTHTHPILSRVDPARQEEEIQTCRRRIEEMCGVAPTAFAYPNGQPGDFTEETQRILRRQGFTLAFAASEGLNGAQADRLALRRFSGRADVPQLAWFRGPRHALA